MDEVWKDIGGDWCRLYQISNHGNVKSADWHKAGRLFPPAPLTPVIDKDGYRRARLKNTDGIRKHKKISRLVAEAFVPNDDHENKVEVDHVDGNEANDLETNLEWVTPTEQQRRRASRARLEGRTTSRYIGVSWNSRDERWCAQLVLNRKRIYIGNYFGEVEAARAYDRYVSNNELDYPINFLIDRIAAPS